ncbi:MAG: YraN family protein [Myxococcota bacterium]
MTTRTARAKYQARSRAKIGSQGEDLVATYLRGRGYHIVGRNVRVKRWELDIIARGSGVIAVCEVRTRTNAKLVHPAKTFDRSKQHKIRQAALHWYGTQKGLRARLRIDAAAVVLEGPNGPQVEYYEGAF